MSTTRSPLAAGLPAGDHVVAVDLDAAAALLGSEWQRAQVGVHASLAPVGHEGIGRHARRAEVRGDWLQQVVECVGVVRELRRAITLRLKGAGTCDSTSPGKQRSCALSRAPAIRLPTAPAASHPLQAPAAPTAARASQAQV